MPLYRVDFTSQMGGMLKSVVVEVPRDEADSLGRFPLAAKIASLANPEAEARADRVAIHLLNPDGTEVSLNG